MHRHRSNRTSPQSSLRTRVLASLAAALLAGVAFAEDAPQPESPARLAFDRFKSLAGSWRGRSTRGWEDVGTWRVIAAGSTVMHDSFGAHGPEAMVTMIHLDGERLMLTHYCVAGNQPRMVATDIAPDARRVVFTFLDATNLPGRDHGHMDKAVFEFVDDDTHRAQWTWYQRGAERWMEAIESVRAAPATRPLE